MYILYRFLVLSPNTQATYYDPKRYHIRYHSLKAFNTASMKSTILRLLLVNFLAIAVASFTNTPSLAFKSFRNKNDIRKSGYKMSADSEIVPSETIGLVVEAEIKPDRMDGKCLYLV